MWRSPGDLDGGFEFAKEAMRLADESGHLRTRVAGAINLSHIMCSRGEFDEAKQYLDYASESAGNNLHLRLAALDSWANLLISTGRYADCRRVLREVVELSNDGIGNRLHWDSLTESFTRARLAQAEGLWPEACSALSEGVELATACGDRFWRRRMLLARGKCLGVIGRNTEACADIKEAMLTDAEQFEGLPQDYSALAASSSTPLAAPASILLAQCALPTQFQMRLLVMI